MRLWADASRGVDDSAVEGSPGLARPRFRQALILSGAVVLAAAVSTVVLSTFWASLVMRCVNTSATTAEAVCFLWTASRARGAERAWRVLIGLAATALTIGYTRIVWIFWVQGTTFPSTSVFDVVFLLAFLLVVAALLVIPTEPVGTGNVRPRRARQPEFLWYAITLLDSVLVVGSIVVLAWATVLGELARSAGADAGTVFALRFAFAVSYLVVLAVAVLLVTFRRRRSGSALAYLAGGLVTTAVVGDTFLYLALRGVQVVHPAVDVLFLAGYLLIILASLAPTFESPRSSARGGPLLLWLHATLPYATLGGLGLVFLVRLLTHSAIGRVELYGLIVLLLLALVRQMVTLAENTRLLARVQAGQQELRHQAYHDPLTGLANRALFTDRLEAALARQAHGHLPIVLVYVDLDDFKRVNDTLGHATGDDLLRITAGRLRASVRPGDTVARLGGDEFAVIVTDQPGEPEAIGRRLAAILRAPCSLAGQPYAVQASFGLTIADSAADPVADQAPGQASGPESVSMMAEVLLKQADLAMYAAKRHEKGSVICYKPELVEQSPPDPQ